MALRRREHGFMGKSVTDAEVNANKKLEIEVSGSGSVRYKGNASVNQRISGSGDIKKVD